eukprot:7368097-Alexandrium_andersonii.AAC.1
MCIRDRAFSRAVMRATVKYFEARRAHEAYPAPAVEAETPRGGTEQSAGEDPDVLGAAAIQFSDR